MYDIDLAQKEFTNRNGEALAETEQAVLFAKILISQTAFGGSSVTFCKDSELFVSKTPVGYDVVGFYFNVSDEKVPFSISISKTENLWHPSKKYVAADTKSCSASILLWILICLGCSLMGILMYFLISASIGI